MTKTISILFTIIKMIEGKGVVQTILLNADNEPSGIIIEIPDGRKFKMWPVRDEHSDIFLEIAEVVGDGR